MSIVDSGVPSDIDPALEKKVLAIIFFLPVTDVGEQIAVQAGSGFLHGNPEDSNQSPTIAPQKARWAGAVDEADKAFVL